MKYFFSLSLAALVALTSCSKKGEGGSAANPMADSMKAAYTAGNELWNTGNANDVDKYLSADFVDHNPMPGTKGTRDDIKNMIKHLREAFPDLKVTIEDMRVDGDILSARVRMAGTNSGPMIDMPATNKKMDIIGIEMTRWKDGKFVESWFGMEEQKMMQQLMPNMGMPAPDSSKKAM